MALLSARNKKEHAVQSFMLSLVNGNCPDLRNLADGPRAEHRVNLTLVALVIPVIENQPAIAQTFAAVTKEFTTLGVSLVLNGPRPVEEVMLGFRWEGEMKWVRAQAKHLSPMGAGFFQLGLQLKEMVPASECPSLESLLV